MYKLVACDLDDTLLRNDFSISENNIRAINDLKKKDVKFVVITGRITAAAKSFVESLDIKLPYGSFQGGKIIDPLTGKTIYSCELEKERIEGIIDYAQKNGVHVNLYDDEKIYVNKATKWSEYYKKFAKNVDIVEVGDLLKYNFQKTPKMVLIDEREKLDLIEPELKSIIDHDINMFFSKKNFLEFTNKNATKGYALKFLADCWGIDSKNVMAIGDNHNDTSMIEYAGLGVCVANGEDEIKKKADYITLSNEDDGVAYVLDKFILNT
jgi:hypothetical protein